ncbi:MAG: ABC transporter substrate-binding protein [Actinomycetota bacterium]|nr:ABC transporter substrate-binding protein [Actinomycetota bacterium]
MKRTVLAFAALAALVALAGCGEKKETNRTPGTRSLDLVLDFFPNADHVGLYAAIADGGFRRVGLNVRPRTPSDPAAPLKLLAAGQADLAISYEPEVLLARDRGLRVVSVGAIVQRPLTSIIALPAGRVRTPADLRGRTVGTAGIPYQDAYLKTILKGARVNPDSVREVNVGFNLVPALLGKRVDATLGGFWNYEGVQLALQRRHPVVIPVDRAGVPAYDELVLVARKDDLRDRGDLVRRFLRGLSSGYELARSDPVRAVDALVKANPSLDRRLQLASVRATLPAFFPADGRKPFGWQDPAQWTRYGAWMLDNQLVQRPPDAGRALTNEFLPGEGI